MIKRERNEKLQVLQAVLEGKPDAVRHYQQRIMKPLFLTIQKESNDTYSVKDLNTPIKLMTSQEYEQFKRSLQTKVHLLICIIRPEQK